MLFSFLILCILSLLSCFLSASAQFIFKTHLMVTVARGRVFSACSWWIKILISSTRVCSDGISHWLHPFPFFERLFCQRHVLLWAENKSRNCSEIYKCIFSSSLQLSEITPESRQRWMEEWKLKESTQLDPVSHISQHDCKSNSNKAQS